MKITLFNLNKSMLNARKNITYDVVSMNNKFSVVEIISCRNVRNYIYYIIKYLKTNKNAKKASLAFEQKKNITSLIRPNIVFSVEGGQKNKKV